MSTSPGSIEISVGQISPRKLLLMLLVVFGVLLSVTVIRGVFIIDEDNYLVTVVGLRHGQLSVPGTEGLTPSRELVYFDPEASRRVVQSTPVVSLVPPLYAFIALPFSFAGWWGLVFLNVLSFLASIYFVFRYTERFARHKSTPWVAAALFGLGGYCIEYAQGMWPEMLSVALCLGTLVLCLNARQTGSVIESVFAGIIVGIAVGVREQNIFFAGCVGLGLILIGPNRVRSAVAFTAGVAVMMLVLSFVNYLRFDLWHPFPKIIGYTQVVAANAGDTHWYEPFRVFWSKVVDYSSYGPNTDHIRSGIYQWDSASGTVLVNGIVRKSWVQSSPWIALAILAFVVCWFKIRGLAPEVRRELRVFAVVVLPTVAMFIAAGFNRTDGLSFNQRYFLELLPLGAIAASLFLDREEIYARWVAAGFIAGITTVAIVLLLANPTLRYAGQRFVPVLLGAGLCVVAVVRGRRSVSLLVGLCIGWAFFFHLESDLVGSRFRRGINRAHFEYLDKVIPDHSALFTFWGNKDAAGPLQLDRDVVILDVWADGGKDAAALEQQLLAQRRTVFILENDIPTEILERLKAGQNVRPIGDQELKLSEILPP